MRYPPLKDRFNANIRVTPGCWLWGGAKLDGGYGVTWSNGRNLSAHRASWQLHFGPIPAGLCVLHRCDNPPCVNPEHLFLGTKGENCTDRSLKGRTAMGEEHYFAKLTEAKVLAIRNGDIQDSKFARLYGVSRSTVHSARTRRTWRHV